MRNHMLELNHRISWTFFVHKKKIEQRDSNPINENIHPI